jgi:hypothetical protein
MQLKKYLESNVSPMTITADIASPENIIAVSGGDNALHWAAKGKHYHLVAFLSQSGANLHRSLNFCTRIRHDVASYDTEKIKSWMQGQQNITPGTFGMLPMNYIEHGDAKAFERACLLGWNSININRLAVQEEQKQSIEQQPPASLEKLYEEMSSAFYLACSCMPSLAPRWLHCLPGVGRTERLQQQFIEKYALSLVTLATDVGFYQMMRNTTNTAFLKAVKVAMLAQATAINTAAKAKSDQENNGKPISIDEERKLLEHPFLILNIPRGRLQKLVRAIFCFINTCLGSKLQWITESCKQVKNINTRSPTVR